MKTLKRPYLTLLLALSLLPSGRASAQGFGFGDTEDSNQVPAAASAPALAVSGALTAGGLFFPEDLEDSADTALQNACQARVDLTASGSAAQAVLRLKLTEGALDAGTAADFLDEAVDEAYLRLFLGSATVDAGYLKVAWGKADSQGPLDVLNPYDMTDLTVLDTLERKISQLMLHASVSLGGMSKLEAVFLPFFEGNAIALTGRWAPAAIGTLLGAGFTSFTEPDTESLGYAQGGLRFTTTSGSVDWGLQYFYGYLPTPAFNRATFPVATILYNRYHQIGADAAAVLAGFNLRAELAANLTEDLAGDDPFVYNPAIAFSLGADRDIAAGINANLQYAGTARLKDGGIGSALDIEYGTDAFSSTLTAVVYQRLFRDKFEWTLRALWGLQDRDCYLLPGLSWTEGDAELKLTAGIFAGDRSGDLGQYRNSSYLKLTLKYTF